MSERNGRPHLDPLTPKRDRVYLDEGHRLRDEPSRDQLRYAMLTGIGGIKLPSRRSRSRRWTTVEAYEWWMNQLDTEEK